MCVYNNIAGGEREGGRRERGEVECLHVIYVCLVVGDSPYKPLSCN